MQKLFVAIAIVTLAVSAVNGQTKNCLGCICEASTGCDKNIGCSHEGGYNCGPFQISWNFWKDAGQPTLRPGDDPNRKGALEDCVNDLECAAITVVEYFKKFEQDCNNDGAITCTDYALMHKLGGYTCAANAFPKNAYFDKLHHCLVKFNEL